MGGARCINAKLFVAYQRCSRVPAVGADAQINEAAVTSATDIISSHRSEDNVVKGEQCRAFAGERNG
jgi:hypothetical protein